MVRYREKPLNRNLKGWLTLFKIIISQNNILSICTGKTLIAFCFSIEETDKQHLRYPHSCLTSGGWGQGVALHCNYDIVLLVLFSHVLVTGYCFSTNELSSFIFHYLPDPKMFLNFLLLVNQILKTLSSKDLQLTSEGKIHAKKISDIHYKKLQSICIFLDCNIPRGNL